MARVGIGVPVYNGGALLRQSLECLRMQTFEDFEVVIGDNASTDETADLCAEYAALDGRFRHIRRPVNLGSLGNFQALRAESTADLFCWRAYDDLSAPDFLEKLVRLFDAPSVRLGVAEVRTQADDKGAARITPYSAPPAWPRIARIGRQLFTAHASWIYGLWHRETLAQLQDRVHRDYPHAWGWDHLTMLPLILDGGIAGTNDTHFLQRIVRGTSTKAQRKAKMPGLADMRALRADFDRVARAIVDERSWSAPERAVLGTLMPLYTDRRGYSRAKLARRAVRLRLGLGQEKA